MPSPIAALLDPVRLRIAASIVDRPRQVDEICVATDLPRRMVLDAIGELRAAELVTAEGDGFVLPSVALRRLARSLTPPPVPMDPTVGYGMTDDERTVLSRFFAGRELTQIPTDRTKRVVVLQRLALAFDVGQRYDEPEVNAALREFHDDPVTLRRYLVDEEFLDREHDATGRTWYWRSGGRVADVNS